jgi:hypothetical protein
MVAAIDTDGHWAVQTVPSPGQYAELNDVSCLSATDCTAVGSTSSPGGGTASGGPLAEHWDGTSWTIQPTADPPSQAAQFYGGSCVTPDNCTAVGTYLPPHGRAYLTLAEHWDGTSWTIQPTPNPGGGGKNTVEATLESVSCPSATTCTAVGQAALRGGDGYAMLAERWNGTHWFIQLVTTPAGDQELGSVSCPTAFRCTAVGNGPSYQEAGAEYWNGHTWTAEPVPAPIHYLIRVSCHSAADCTAVTAGAIVHWDGTSWAIQPVPSPHGHPSWTLYGVSCPSATACTATGFVTLPHRINPLVEHH